MAAPDQMRAKRSSKLNREQDEQKEEAVIIDERGGAQEHHNQTMDEVYHQNTNDKDGQIECNVVSNPNNFLNSMILHDKNDLNDPSPVIPVGEK